MSFEFNATGADSASPISGSPISGFGPESELESDLPPGAQWTPFPRRDADCSDDHAVSDKFILGGNYEVAAQHGEGTFGQMEQKSPMCQQLKSQPARNGSRVPARTPFDILEEESYVKVDKILLQALQQHTQRLESYAAKRGGGGYPEARVARAVAQLQRVRDGAEKRCDRAAKRRQEHEDALEARKTMRGHVSKTDETGKDKKDSNKDDEARAEVLGKIKERIESGMTPLSAFSLEDI